MEKTIDRIKLWVVRHSFVTNPYKMYWSASVTLGGQDVNGTGDTIENAYKSLAQIIYASEFLKTNWVQSWIKDLIKDNI